MDRDAEIAELKARLAALEAETPVVAPIQKTAEPLSPLAIVGIVVVVLLIVLVLLGQTPGAGTPTVGSPIVTRATRAAEIASLSEQLPVTLGRGLKQYGMTTYPVIVENQTGRPLSYLQVDCVFYDAGGALIGNEMTNWTNVAAGARTSGSIMTQIPDIDRYECRAQTNG